MIGAVIPLYVLCKIVWPHKVDGLKIYFYKRLLKLIGFQVHTHGTIATAAPVFFVANHTSYLDIPVLGSLLPASFIAKAEVASWPLFGFMAKLLGTVFIERRSIRAKQQRDTLTEHLAARQNLILFPEGTSTDGQMVLPFKSTLFSAIETAAKDIPILVQPVSIGCTAIDGLPMTQNLRHFYTWFGDMTLMPHLWQAFKCNRLTIHVVFHTPINVHDVPDRKKLAALSHQAVSEGIEHCVTGRWDEPDKEAVRIAPPHA